MWSRRMGLHDTSYRYHVATYICIQESRQTPPVPLDSWDSVLCPKDPLGPWTSTELSVPTRIKCLEMIRSLAAIHPAIPIV